VSGRSAGPTTTKDQHESNHAIDAPETATFIANPANLIETGHRSTKPPKAIHAMQNLTRRQGPYGLENLASQRLESRLYYRLQVARNSGIGRPARIPEMVIRCAATLPAASVPAAIIASSRPDPQQGWETTGLLASRTSAREPQQGFLGVGRDERAVFGQHVTTAEAATVCQQRTVLTKQ
jgi:hypothetical protein